MTEHEILAELVRHRRALHRIPELDFELPQTVAYVTAALSELSCEVFSPCESCVCALFDVGAGASVAIRADMDALPIAEETGVAFASCHPGRMHACGHDAHMAMALTAARLVDEALRAGERLARNVLFVFQPAEETTGGARVVCESGVFERVRAERIFGFHVWPDLPAGVVASRPGALLARSSETHVHVRGRSTHIAKTLGVADADSGDALLAAARFAGAAHDLMDQLGEEEPCICRFGLLEAGTVCNAVAADAHVAGSLRVFSDEMFDRAQAGLSEELARACAAFGCEGEVDFAEGYPPVTNDPALFSAAAGALPELQTIETPLLIAEDFAFYQRVLPGVFFLLGVGGGELGASSDLHTSTLMFDEKILLAGVRVYERLVRLP